MEEEREWCPSSFEYLRGKRVVKKDYPASRGEGHCEFCWGEYGPGEKQLKTGYYEPESDSWICEKCFGVFKDIYAMELTDA